MENERLKIVLDFTKFLVGTLLLGGISLAVSSSFKNREETLKEKESERLELELMGKYIEYALTDNVATRERFAQYFVWMSRNDQTRSGWVSYLKEVREEKASTESRMASLSAQAKQLEGLVASDKAKAEELRIVKQQLKDAMDQLSVRNAVAPGGKGVGRASFSGGAAIGEVSSLSGSGSAVTSGSGVLTESGAGGK